METFEIISSIFIYFILPVLVIFGAMFFIRRSRDKAAGRKRSNSIKSIKEDESYDARHEKANDPTQKTQTNPSKEKDDDL